MSLPGQLQNTAYVAFLLSTFTIEARSLIRLSGRFRRWKSKDVSMGYQVNYKVPFLDNSMSLIYFESASRSASQVKML